MICIYHGIDLDGWTSAAIVKEKYPDCQMYPFDYGQEIPEIKDRDVIMVDCSFKPDVYKKLLTEGKCIIWIDHHISAINDFDKELRYEVQGNSAFKAVLNPKKAACELTWEFINPNQKMPEGVRLLGRYDCFGHKGTEEEHDVLIFQYAARARWDGWESVKEVFRLTKTDFDNMAIQGQYIYDYLIVEAKQTYAKRFIIEFDEYKFLAVNQERFNPINFGIDYHKEGFDGFACFAYKGNLWTFSLYNDNGKVDCSAICKKRGGGGHAGAAGFTTKNINDYVKQDRQHDSPDRPIS